MARLCIPGFPFSKDRAAARFKTQPAFRSFPRRVTYRANSAIPCPSFVPVSPLRAGVRSFDEMRKGSRLPIRSPAPAPTPSPSFTKPRPAKADLNLSRLEERKIARQARPRPWVQTGSTGAKQSLRGHLSKRNHAEPSKAQIPATRKVTARVGNVPAKPMTLVNGRKDKSVRKCVRFGETTVRPVSRWIVRQRDVFRAPSATIGHLQGWKVTPLSEPDEDGEEEKYTTYWGSDSYVMLTSNHSEGPCDRMDCAWNSLARIQARRPAWTPETVFKAWHLKRAMTRKQGRFALWLVFCPAVILVAQLQKLKEDNPGRWFPIYRDNNAPPYAVIKP